MTDQDIRNDEDWFYPGDDDTAEHGDTGNGHNGAVKDDFNFADVLDAPDFSTFIKQPKTGIAREYEKKIKSLVKAGVFHSIQSGNYPDAAALIYHGPAFSAAAGELANVNDLTRKGIDILTSPSNPYAMFVIAALPLVAQLLRNREGMLQDLPEARKHAKAARKAAREDRKKQPRKPWFKVRVLGREFGVGVRIGTGPFSSLFTQVKAQTHDPGSLTYTVFSDPKLLKELSKQGIEVRMRRS